MKKEQLPRIGFAIIMLASLYLLIRQISHGVPLNLATWAMFTLMDISLLFSIISAGNKRPWAMIGFTTSAILIFSVALTRFFMGSGEAHWGNTETLAAVSVGIAMLVWKMTNGNVGMVAITAAMAIATIPTFADQIRSPFEQDPVFWAGWAVGCLLELIGKKNHLRNHSSLPVECR